MAQIKTILCLGNQTEDSTIQSVNWADKFGLPYQGLLGTTSIANSGVYFSDLAQLSMDNCWTLTDLVDLIIMLDQPVESFDCVETYQHFTNLCRYKKNFMPVLFPAVDAPTVWLDQLTDNSQVLPAIVAQDLYDVNLIIKLYTVNDINLFGTQLTTLVDELKKRKCKWIMYRAGQHEELHFQATQMLLNHPEFVLLNPAVFSGNIVANIRQRIYHHWVNLYCKEQL